MYPDKLGGVKGKPPPFIAHLGMKLQGAFPPSSQGEDKENEGKFQTLQADDRVSNPQPSTMRRMAESIRPQWDLERAYGVSETRCLEEATRLIYFNATPVSPVSVRLGSRKC